MNKIAVVLLFLMFIGFAPQAIAQQQKNTITLEPALVDIELAEDETEHKTAFTLKNSYNVPVELSVQIQGIDEQNGLFIPSSEADEQIINALKLSDTTVLIPENSNAVVYMTIDTPRLSPGGHYATFVVTQEKIGTTNVAIKQSVSAGLFIVKGGGQVREVEPAGVSFSRNVFGMPTAAVITLKNVGNVHIIPRASVTVYDGETLVAKGIYNSDSRRILPARQYQESVSINSVARSWLPSKLKVVFEYRADSIEEYRFSETYIWYVPPLFIGAVSSGLLVLLMGLATRKKVIRKKKYPYPEDKPHESEDLSDNGDNHSATRISVRRVQKKSAPKKITIISEE